MLAITVNNQCLCGLFDFCLLREKLETFVDLPNAEESETFEQGLYTVQAVSASRVLERNLSIDCVRARSAGGPPPHRAV